MIPKIKDELLINKRYLILSIIISIYVFLPLFYISSIKQMLTVFLSIVILFIMSKVSKIVFILSSTVTLFINSMMLHIGFLWGTNSISSRIEVASLSPKSESIEYLITYLGVFDIFIFFYILTGIYILYRFMIQLKHSYVVVKVLSLFLLFTILLVLFIKDDILKIRPLIYIKQYTEIADIDKIRERNNYINNMNYKMNKLNNNLEYDKVIIVMGESANKNHMSVYNYDINTTPFLDNLLKDYKGFKYNVIAPTNQTRYSVPINLTNATVDNFNLFFTTKSIITTFRDYGYRTYWLSNQGMVGKHENYISTISNEANFIKTANMVYTDAKYDDVLIKYLDQMEIDNNSKEFFLIHLMGSHANYEKRYPSNEALFKNPKNIIEKYDNTICYTDKILKKIYDKFKNSKLLFIYVSDHAEVVNNNKNGHGYLPAYKDEYEIPLIAYSSLENDRLNKLKIFNNQSIFNMESFNNFIEYTAGIDLNISNISTSSNVFTLEPNNIFDYNKLKSFNIEKDEL